MTTQAQTALAGLLSEYKAGHAGEAAIAAVGQALHRVTEFEAYNGWPNRETWATALHLSNDESLYLAAREAAKADRFGDGIKALVERMSEIALDPSNTPDPEFAVDGIGISRALCTSMVSDVGSFWRVDWPKVRESLVEDAQDIGGDPWARYEVYWLARGGDGSSDCEVKVYVIDRRIKVDAKTLFEMVEAVRRDTGDPNDPMALDMVSVGPDEHGLYDVTDFGGGILQQELEAQGIEDVDGCEEVKA